MKKSAYNEVCLYSINKTKYFSFIYNKLYLFLVSYVDFQFHLYFLQVWRHYWKSLNENVWFVFKEGIDRVAIIFQSVNHSDLCVCEAALNYFSGRNQKKTSNIYIFASRVWTRTLTERGGQHWRRWKSIKNQATNWSKYFNETFFLHKFWQSIEKYKLWFWKKLYTDSFCFFPV